VIRGLVAIGALLWGCGQTTRTVGRYTEKGPATTQGGAAGAAASGEAAAAGAGEIDAPTAGAGGAASCACVTATIDWWVDAPARPPGDYVGKGHIAPCSAYEYDAERDGEPPVITSQLSLPCQGDFGIESVNAALADPELQAALAGPAVVFGMDKRPEGGHIDHIEVGGKVILIGDECADQPGCRLPAGVNNLDGLLAQIQRLY
jgi:hypothetical protein